MRRRYRRRRRLADSRATQAVARARRRAGAGWSLLGPELQEALVAKECITVVVGLDTEPDDPCDAKLVRLQTMILDAMSMVEG